MPWYEPTDFPAHWREVCIRSARPPGSEGGLLFDAIEEMRHFRASTEVRA
jgi:hypothetical protein